MVEIPSVEEEQDAPPEEESGGSGKEDFVAAADFVDEVRFVSTGKIPPWCELNSSCCRYNAGEIALAQPIILLY